MFGFDMPTLAALLVIVVVAAIWIHRVLTKPVKTTTGDYWVRPVVLPPDED